LIVYKASEVSRGMSKCMSLLPAYLPLGEHSTFEMHDVLRRVGPESPSIAGLADRDNIESMQGIGKLSMGASCTLQ